MSISAHSGSGAAPAFSLANITTNRFFPAAMIALFVLLVRLPNAFYAAMDWDETTYSMVAVEILKGHLPFTVAFDHKADGPLSGVRRVHRHVRAMIRSRRA
ncbi:MAG: hypothetical protein WDN76_08720 [Alphaproteobacteria bacterium]